MEIYADNVIVRGFKISGDNPLLDGYNYAGMNVEVGFGVYSEGNNVEILTTSSKRPPGRLSCGRFQ
jgi:hypothetical protein